MLHKQQNLSGRSVRQKIHWTLLCYWIREINLCGGHDSVLWIMIIEKSAIFWWSILIKQGYIVHWLKSYDEEDNDDYQLLSQASILDCVWRFGLVWENLNEGKKKFFCLTRIEHFDVLVGKCYFFKWLCCFTRHFYWKKWLDLEIYF